ncbi:mechanosensitive ion channel family protein [Opitutaceae bacterium EW11]|nr:mechanosensitive ion channel family protein [Opitutaceae bacterium EW11]
MMPDGGETPRAVCWGMSLQLPDVRVFWTAFLHALPAVVLILAAALALQFLLRRILLLVAHRTSFTESEVQPVERVVRWMISIAALGFVLQAFGMNVSGLWGVLSTILAMVAIGFVAVWSVLSNTLCTLIILVFRPFAVGDELEFPGEPVKGRVVDLNFIYTSLQTEDGAVMQVPNNLFFQKVLRRRHSAAPVSLANQFRAKSPARNDPMNAAGVPAR